MTTTATDVFAFMEREGLNNLSCYPYKCPDCNVQFQCNACECCGKDGGEFPVEPYFSWRPCIACGDIAGDRYDCNGYSDRDGCVKEYEGGCEACVYRANYGG